MGSTLFRSTPCASRCVAIRRERGALRRGAERGEAWRGGARRRGAEAPGYPSGTCGSFGGGSEAGPKTSLLCIAMRRAAGRCEAPQGGSGAARGGRDAGRCGAEAPESPGELAVASAFTERHRPFRRVVPAP